MTNMERLRTLPRYRLAEFLMEKFKCPNGDPAGCDGYHSNTCMCCWIGWLEVNEDGE